MALNLTFGPRRRALSLLGLFVAVVGVTELVLQMQLAHPPTTDPWYQVLFYPALPGYLALGGIHSDAPDWLLNAAACVSEGVVVTGFVWILLEMVRLARRQPGEGPSA